MLAFRAFLLVAGAAPTSAFLWPTSPSTNLEPATGCTSIIRVLDDAALEKQRSSVQDSFLNSLRPPSALAIDINVDQKEEVIITRGLKRGEGRLMDLTKKSVDPSSARIILDEIKFVEQDTGAEVQVVVADDINTKAPTPKRFAKTLFNDWRLGPADKKNGVLVLVLLKQRRVEIEVGKGLNIYMGEEWCTNLLEKEAVPSFKAEQYGQGLANTVVGVAKRLREVNTKYVRQKALEEECNEKLGFGAGVALLAVAGNELYENQYPLGINNTTCSGCGRKQWRIADVEGVKRLGWSSDDGFNLITTGGGWEIVKNATDQEAGQQRMACRCTNCGYLKYKTMTIPKYDGKRLEADGSYTYYYGSSFQQKQQRKWGRVSMGGRRLLFWQMVQIFIFEFVQASGGGASW